MDKRMEANLRVKQSITDALFFLMQKKDLSGITVTEIIETAKVARASFYRNYKSKEDVISVFISDVFERFRGDRDPATIDYKSRSHVKRIFVYFKMYAHYFMELYRANLSMLVLEELNNFQSAIAGNMPANSVERYSIYFYTGALFDTLTEWIKTGTSESVDDMTDVFCRQIEALS